MFNKEQIKVRIGRQYAQYILETNDSIAHTSYKFGVSPSTIRNYINYLKLSSDSDDIDLYNKVKKILKTRKWGKSFIRA